MVCSGEQTKNEASGEGRNILFWNGDEENCKTFLEGLQVSPAVLLM
jgi:hypothetical protein